MAETTWQLGDRVVIVLPDRNRRGRGGRPQSIEVYGTVRDVDPPGLPPGVRVDLDHAVSGVADCYATHSELRPARADSLEADHE